MRRAVTAAESGTRRRRLGSVTGLAVLCAALAGCGIRTTSVPVDAGAAPSRVPCELAPEDIATQSTPGIPLEVYLVCGAQLVSVDRAVRIPEEKLMSDRVRVAQTLLDELQREPSAEERQAGFTTVVRDTLAVSGPRKGDAKNTLRLSSQPEDLPTHALAQIVCTYADSAASGSDGAVILGGPSDDPARGYQCTSALKDRPDAVPTVGETRPSR
ncbi:hypothetical protein [Streptomyces spiramyceticus]|uniref:hypothetical protein n=1 Tax=Streptomyces spiramyceticus TaxID=299717 RepID=UPI00237BBDD3|nr:hypothetical protein [Streptomyces spiramyceticus]